MSFNTPIPLADSHRLRRPLRVPGRFAALSIAAAIGLIASFQPGQAQAAEIEVRITNLTRGSHFTPLLVAAHPLGTALFKAGEPASAPLQTMAEGGDIGPLVDVLKTLNCEIGANPANGLLAPGRSALQKLQAGAGTGNVLLSVVAMILPSNDGFIGLNAIPIPITPGTYSYDLPVYDAGTEANDEKRGSGVSGQPGFPIPPPLEASTPVGGAGVAAFAEGFVHVHRGVLGDTDARGGRSDIDATTQRWLNPAARVVVTVK